MGPLLNIKTEIREILFQVCIEFTFKQKTSRDQGTLGTGRSCGVFPGPTHSSFFENEPTPHSRAASAAMFVSELVLLVTVHWTGMDTCPKFGRSFVFPRI